jgi:hypothetical protein
VSRDHHGPLQGDQQIHWRDEKGPSELFTPYVLDNLLFSLWGRDELEHMGAVLIAWSLTKCFNKAIIPLRDWEDINKVGYILYNL